MLTTEPTLKDQLLADYDEHEKRVEIAACDELWTLGDWLAEYVPPRHPGPRRDSEAGFAISLDDLAARGRRSVRQLQTLRKVAMTTEADRLPLITPTAYHEALRACEWDLMAANARLVTLGHRKRDQRSGPHESLNAIRREVSKRPPEDRAELARELIAEPTVRDLLAGETPPDFGAHWADKLVLRISEQSDKLTSLVQREGLVFAPGADLHIFLDLLNTAERQIAEVRAAVQERVRDEQIGSVV